MRGMDCGPPKVMEILYAPLLAAVLVVDDKDVATPIRFVLEKDGHRVEDARNGRETLERRLL